MKGLKVIEGRAPLHPNEMMFATNAAKRMKVGVGDVVTVVTATGQENFIVSGLVQVLNNMGMMAYMTIDGYSVVYGPVREYNYEVFLKDGYDLDDFRAEFGDRYPDVEVVDFKQNAEGTVGVIKLGVKAIAILIALLTALIVAFVESLIIKTQITRAWRDLGVSKALGYTSGQLILQTMLSNMPSVLIGIVLGLIVSFFSAEKLMRILFSLFEFRKAPFYVNPGSYVIAIVLIAGIALLTSAWIGRRIRTLEPVKMITEE
jgi:ABC-type lipoprotein release transport system permease subunit